MGHSILVAFILIVMLAPNGMVANGRAMMPTLVVMCSELQIHATFTLDAMVALDIAGITRQAWAMVGIAMTVSMLTQIRSLTNVRFTSSVVATQRGMALFGCADASVVLVLRTCTVTYSASRCHDALTPTPGNQCLAVEKLLLKAADLAASSKCILLTLTCSRMFTHSQIAWRSHAALKK